MTITDLLDRYTHGDLQDRAVVAARCDAVARGFDRDAAHVTSWEVHWPAAGAPDAHLRVNYAVRDEPGELFGVSRAL